MSFDPKVNNNPVVSSSVKNVFSNQDDKKSVSSQETDGKIQETARLRIDYLRSTLESILAIYNRKSLEHIVMDKEPGSGGRWFFLDHESNEQINNMEKNMANIQQELNELYKLYPQYKNSNTTD